MSSARSPESGNYSLDSRVVIPLPSSTDYPISEPIPEKKGGDRFWNKMGRFGVGFGVGAVMGAGVVCGVWLGSNSLEGIRVESATNFPVFNQRDSIWALGNPHWYWRAGCGPTAVAMIMKHFDKNSLVNPSTVDKDFEAKGIRKNPTDGTLFRSGPNGQYDVLNWLNDKGYEWKQIQDARFPIFINQKEFDFKVAKQAINEGYRLVISGVVVNWVEVAPEGADHIMVGLDVDENTKSIKIADPWGGEIRDVKLDKNFFKDGKLSYAYAIRPKKIS